VFSWRFCGRDADLSPAGMNVLSGSTWKGSKLRVGEAKPDFKERYVPIVYLKLPAFMIH
jgi:hypothetical protein